MLRWKAPSMLKLPRGKLGWACGLGKISRRALITGRASPSMSGISCVLFFPSLAPSAASSLPIGNTAGVSQSEARWHFQASALPCRSGILLASANQRPGDISKPALSLSNEDRFAFIEMRTEFHPWVRDFSLRLASNRNTARERYISICREMGTGTAGELVYLFF